MNKKPQEQTIEEWLKDYDSTDCQEFWARKRMAVLSASKKLQEIPKKEFDLIIDSHKNSELAVDLIGSGSGD